MFVYLHNDILNDIGNAIREKSGASTKFLPSQFAQAIRNLGEAPTGTPLTSTVTSKIVLMQDSTLTAIAEAIREKLGITDLLLPSQMAEKIRSITIDSGFHWGDETAIGDAQWWADLKDWLSAANSEEKTACLGKTKKVSLSSPVLGANAVLMRCIGVEQDGNNTLTFQSTGTLPNVDKFEQSSTSSRDSAWEKSRIRTVHCNNFYLGCSAKDSIKQVNRKNYATNNNYVITVDSIWIPSATEMGISTTSGGQVKVPTGEGIKYSWYSSNANRIKYKLDNNGDTDGSVAPIYCTRSIGTNNYADGLFRVITINSTGVGYGSDGYTTEDTYRIAPAFVIG